MNEKFQKLIEKKKKMGKELSPVESAAKGSVLGDLKEMAGKAMSDKLHGLKKVSVASDSPEGLKSGLEKAHDIVSGGEEHGMVHDAEGGEQDEKDMLGASEEAEGDSDGSSLSPDQGDAEMGEGSVKKEHEHMTPEELDEEIKKLQEMRKAKKSVHNPY